jgi:alkylation response protein AidB-like acyl-CoA dehydrogenase
MVSFQDVVVPQENVVGNVGEGFKSESGVVGFASRLAEMLIR